MSAKKSQQAAVKTAAPSQPARPPVRQSVTFESVKALAPTPERAERIAATFGLEAVHYPGIRENVEEHVVRLSNELRDNLNDRAMAMFLQRVVGAFVGAAFGSATFYSAKRAEASALHTRIHDDDRSMDRGGVAGFEDRAARAANFAAELGLQATALMAAAEGACSAFEHVTGSAWKPYEGSVPASAGIEQRATKAKLDALSDD